MPNLGFASKHYSPPFPGIGNFKGSVFHTAQWPQHDAHLKGKRVAVIGTGASGIQTIQEVGPKAKHLTVYQRTPNMCLPMQQKPVDPAEEEQRKKDGTYEKLINDTRSTFSGFTYDFVDKNTFDDTPEDREKFWEKVMLCLYVSLSYMFLQPASSGKTVVSVSGSAATKISSSTRTPTTKHTSSGARRS